MAERREIPTNRAELMQAVRQAFVAADYDLAEGLLSAALAALAAQAAGAAGAAGAGEDWELLGLSGAVAIARGQGAAAIPRLTRALELYPPSSGISGGWCCSMISAMATS